MRPVILCPRAENCELDVFALERPCELCGTALGVTPAAGRFLQRQEAELLCWACGRKEKGPIRWELLPGQDEEITRSGLKVKGFLEGSARALAEP